MNYVLLYALGDSPDCRNVQDFPDLEAAKVYARESIADTLKSSSADSATLRIGQARGDGEDDVQWLGAYDLDSEGEPVWSNN